MNVWGWLAVIVFLIPVITTPIIVFGGLSVKIYDANQWLILICGILMAVFIIIGNLTR